MYIDKFKDEFVQKMGKPFIISCSSVYISNEIKRVLTELFLPDNDPNAIEYFDETVTVDDIIFSSESISMFCPNKLIFVSNYPKLKDSIRDKLLKFMLTFNNGTTVVFIDSIGSFSTGFAKVPKMSFNGLNLGDLSSEITFWAQKANRIISHDDVTYFCKLCDNNVDSAYNEFLKLSAYADKVIDREMIDKLVIKNRDLQMYLFTGALTEGNYATALELLDYFTSRGDSPALILAAITAQYRRMLHASLSNASDSELSKLFGVKDTALFYIKKYAKNYTKKTLMSIVRILYDLEYKFKSGAMSDSNALSLAVSTIIKRSSTR